MSLTAHERRALGDISEGLTASDPALAGLLDAFTRVTSRELMPARERIEGRWERARGLAGRVRSAGRRPAASVVIIVTLLMLIALIAGLTVTTFPATRGPWPGPCTVICVRPAPVAHANRLTASAHDKS